MSDLNVGIVGAGSIAEHAHIPAYRSHPKVNLWSVAEVDDTRRREVAETYPVDRVYEDGFSMIDDEPLDIVSICTPPQSHKSLFIYAVKNDCHVYCEKPMATGTDETEAMRDAADNSSVVTQIGYTVRYANNYKKVLNWKETGMLGETLEATFHCLVNPPGDEWRYDPSVSGGGVVTENLPHWLDFYLELLNGDADVTEAELRSVHTSGVEDYATTTLSANGSTVRIVAKWVEPGMTYQTQKQNVLVASEGEVKFDREHLDGNIRGHGVQFKYGETADISLGPLFQHWVGASEALAEKPITDFVEHVADGSHTQTPAAWGHKVTQLREQIYRVGES